MLTYLFIQNSFFELYRSECSSVALKYFVCRLSAGTCKMKSPSTFHIDLTIYLDISLELKILGKIVAASRS